MQPSPRADTASPLFPSARFFISPPPGFCPGNLRTRPPSVLRVESLVGHRKVHDSLDQARHGGDERPAEDHVKNPPSDLSEGEPVDPEAAEKDGEDRGGDAPADAARALEGRVPHAAPGGDLRPGVYVGQSR